MYVSYLENFDFIQAVSLLGYFQVQNFIFILVKMLQESETI